MNILIVNTFYYPVMPGGAEHSVKNLAESLVKKGHNVSVLCTGNNDKIETINGVLVYRIKNINIKSAQMYLNNKSTPIQKLIYRCIDLYGYLNLSKIKNIIDAVKPDIAHVNNIPGIGLNIFNILDKENIPTIFTARDYYSVCLNSTLMNSKGKVCTKKRKICKLYENINKLSISKVKSITAPSKFTLELIKDSINQPKIRYECINNSIDINIDYIEEVFNYKKEQLNSKNHLDLVFLGRLDEYKGIKLLIDYFIKINNNNIKLHIAGDGNLTSYIQNLGVDNIIYYGKLDKFELDKLLKNMDVLIAPSLWYEPFGRIVIDAYKYSMPVISTGNGGLKELIKEDKTGYIIDFKNIEEFKRIIDKYTNKEILLEHMINCNKEVIKYSNEVIVDQYENLYKEIMKGS